MDDRFPLWLRRAVKRLDFLALPSLGKFVVAAAIVAFVAKNIVGVPMEKIVFDPQAVLDGEVWRLLVFPSQGISDPLWLLFFVLYIFFVFNSIELSWGPGPLTVYTLLSYLAAIGGAFLVGHPIPVWLYIVENVSLAFGTLFPELELYIYFILPVKAKWLACLAGAIILYQFFSTNITGKLFFCVALSPYLLFFSPLLVSWARGRIRAKRSRFDDKDWRR